MSFTPVSVYDIIFAISSLPDKSSAADPYSVSMMKLIAHEIAPFLS